MTKRAPKYWICDKCAKKKKLTTKYPKGGNTFILGLCGHCNRKDESDLTPVVDFKEVAPNVWD